jgi:hypothetical protein
MKSNDIGHSIINTPASKLLLHDILHVPKAHKNLVGVLYPGYHGSPVTTKKSGYDLFPPAANSWGTMHPVLGNVLTLREISSANSDQSLKRNHSKPGDPSTESNPHRFGLSTGNPRRHRRQEEAVSHPHTEDSKSKA